MKPLAIILPLLATTHTYLVFDNTQNKSSVVVTRMQEKTHIAPGSYKIFEINKKPIDWGVLQVYAHKTRYRVHYSRINKSTVSTQIFVLNTHTMKEEGGTHRLQIFKEIVSKL